jgi:prepilin-type N-terminal cleavage/methylation domain-containing protein
MRLRCRLSPNRSTAPLQYTCRLPAGQRDRSVTGAGRSRCARPGFTLLELIIVTALLSLLALIAAGPVMRARERAMVAAARAEIAQLTRSVAHFEAVNARLPQSLADLDGADLYEQAKVEICRFELTSAAGSEPAHLIIEARHPAARVGATTHYPVWNGRIDEVEMLTCGGGGGGGEEGAGPGDDGPGGGPGQGRGRGQGRGGGRGN